MAVEAVDDAQATDELRPGQVRQLLRECVTVVKPGETLVMRGCDWTPEQVRAIREWMDRERESGRISFRVLVVPGDELAVVQPESDASFLERLERAWPEMTRREMLRASANYRPTQGH
jgi:hypothetical protein